MLTAAQGARRADGGRWSALADLLPSVAGRVSDSRQTINLAAFGFPLPPGTPSLVGPFSVFDARVAVSQPILDLRARGLGPASYVRLLEQAIIDWDYNAWGGKYPPFEADDVIPTRVGATFSVTSPGAYIVERGTQSCAVFPTIQAAVDRGRAGFRSRASRNRR